MDVHEWSLLEKALNSAQHLIQSGFVSPETDFYELADTLIKLDAEKKEKDTLSDSYIDYNDEIESIEFAGELETIDISVTGDNLFYCNNILTKNSFGLPATCDWMCGIIQTPELFEQRKYLLKNIKSRFDSNINQVVTVGIDYNKMRLLNLNEEDQEVPLHIKDRLKKAQAEKDNSDELFDFD